MLSLGSAAFSEDGRLLDTFSVNLTQLEGASPDPETMKWWEGQPAAWAACRMNLHDPELGMRHFVEWVRGFSGKSVFVGYPATFDFLFVYWYIRRFGLESPFSFSAIDIKSYAMALLGTGFRKTTKKAMPKEWFGSKRHTHLAVDDAVEQGELFIRMREWSRRGQWQAGEGHGR